MLKPSIHGDLSAGAKHWRGTDDGDAAAYTPTATPAYDPYAPGSDDYETRTREEVIELPGGLLRVDYGASS
jgi:hypothetical protein